MGNNMKVTIQQAVAACIAVGMLSACGSGGPANGTKPLTPPSQVNVANNVLQFAVGTANLAGGTATGLNVVATYRQPTGGTVPGDSGTLINSPTLTIPGTLPAAPGTAQGYDPNSTIVTGPGTADAGTSAMASTSQSLSSYPAATTTFGVSGGAFGLGLEPFNAQGAADNGGSQGTIGAPFQVAPYPVPVYDTVASDPNQFVPWGGPPAFNPLGNGQSPVGANNVPAGEAGVVLGLDVFQGVAATPGAYQLSVVVPANTGAVTASQAFTLPAGAALLGNAVAAVPSADGSGGGTFAVTLPARATEAYVEVIDFGPATGASCNGASAGGPVYYTMETSASGALTLPDAAGPGGAPSICTAAQNTATNTAATTGDQFSVITIGFDYPAYESSYPNSSGNPAPTILGANGSDDITISTPVCSMDTGGGALGACTGAAPTPLSLQHRYTGGATSYSAHG